MVVRFTETGVSSSASLFSLAPLEACRPSPAESQTHFADDYGDADQLALVAIFTCRLLWSRQKRQ
jgi:hypothetical protein